MRACTLRKISRFFFSISGKGLSEIFRFFVKMTCIYVRFNNLKRTGQLRNVWVEFGFGTVCQFTVV